MSVVLVSAAALLFLAMGIKALVRPNSLLFDIEFVITEDHSRNEIRSHAQNMKGDLACTIEANLPRIGHIQPADNPGRRKPGTGEVIYALLPQRSDEIGTTGWVGFEYISLTTTHVGHSWLQPYLG